MTKARDKPLNLPKFFSQAREAVIPSREGITVYTGKDRVKHQKIENQKIREYNKNLRKLNKLEKKVNKHRQKVGLDPCENKLSPRETINISPAKEDAHVSTIQQYNKLPNRMMFLTPVDAPLTPEQQREKIMRAHKEAHQMMAKERKLKK